MRPDSQYTKVADSWIGYQIVGEGPIDLFYITGMASNIETTWDVPPYARALERPASYSRLIVFDPRGAGISDGIRSERIPTWEQLAEDVKAVLDAANSERAALLAQFDGTVAAILFAATYPERVSTEVRSEASLISPPGGDSKTRPPLPNLSRGSTAGPEDPDHDSEAVRFPRGTANTRDARRAIRSDRRSRGQCSRLSLYHSGHRHLL